MNHHPRSCSLFRPGPPRHSARNPAMAEASAFQPAAAALEGENFGAADQTLDDLQGPNYPRPGRKPGNTRWLELYSQTLSRPVMCAAPERSLFCCSFREAQRSTTAGPSRWSCLEVQRSVDRVSGWCATIRFAGRGELRPDSCRARPPVTKSPLAQIGQLIQFGSHRPYRHSRSLRSCCSN
jgi:hypothetical protein